MTAAWTISGAKARQGDKLVLDAASLVARSGEVVGVVGPNGAGKTSLLRAGLGLLPLVEGEALLSGKRLAAVERRERASLVGYLPQDRRVAWNLPAEMVASLGAVRPPDAEALVVAHGRLARVGAADLAGRGVLDMSGGERARVLLARLLTTRAPLLVADEPVAGSGSRRSTADTGVAARRGRQWGGGGRHPARSEPGGALLRPRGGDRRGAGSSPRARRRAALSPEILARVFRLDGALIETLAADQ
jgi:iron complex transport system ATP-binding protein